MIKLHMDHQLAAARSIPYTPHHAVCRSVTCYSPVDFVTSRIYPLIPNDLNAEWSAVFQITSRDYVDMLPSYMDPISPKPTVRIRQTLIA